MYELSEQELFEAIHYARSIDEESGAKIIEQFQLEQPALAQAIFGIFPSIIAEQNQEISYLFMDLCFDVLCVFQHAFGPLPSQSNMNYDWLEKQAMLLIPELQSMVKERQMEDKIRSKLQDQFVQRSLDETVQKGLVNFMNMAIDGFVSENPGSAPSSKITQTMIFIVIRLFGNLYGGTSNAV
ncbi:MAG: hypothetical protein EPN17_13875 [Methylobacter sp.]|nr:MAG: hypothetical protein EPN17_13875 [Methylobacter sp.]